MNNDDFERQLSRRVQTPLPAHWRSEILGVAYTERAEAIAIVNTGRSWLSGVYLRWGSFAAVWILIAVFNFTEPSMRSPQFAGTPTDAKQEVFWQEQQRLVAELLEPSPNPPEPPAEEPERKPRSGSRVRADQPCTFI